MHVDELLTPIMVVDLAQVEKNLAKMQRYCDEHALTLRPHIKTHKIVRFAKRQLELGSGGITCQKIGEAFVMAEAGIRDIFISYPIIGAANARRLAELSEIARVKVAADSETAVRFASMAGEFAKKKIGVLIDFDSGAKRTGVSTVEEAVALSELAESLEGTSFEGLMTYPTLPGTAPFVKATQEALAKEGLKAKVVSGGGTPDAWTAHTVEDLTEVRVGTYIYYDRSQVEAGAATLEECAAHVYATVVSRPALDRAILDSGSKSLSSDLSKFGEDYGLIREYPAARIIRLYEEHAVVDISACASKPEIGERVRVLPNHICPVSNLHDQVATVKDGGVVEMWNVDARGKSR